MSEHLQYCILTCTYLTLCKPTIKHGRSSGCPGAFWHSVHHLIRPASHANLPHRLPDWHICSHPTLLQECDQLFALVTCLRREGFAAPDNLILFPRVYGKSTFCDPVGVRLTIRLLFFLIWTTLTPTTTAQILLCSLDNLPLVLNLSLIENEAPPR